MTKLQGYRVALSRKLRLYGAATAFTSAVLLYIFGSFVAFFLAVMMTSGAISISLAIGTTIREKDKAVDG